MSDIKFWTDLRDFYRSGPVLDQSREVGTIAASIDEQIAAEPHLRLWLIVGFVDVENMPWITVAPEVSAGMRRSREIIVQPEALDVRVRPMRSWPIVFDVGRTETMPYCYEQFWAWRPTGLVTVNPVEEREYDRGFGDDLSPEAVRLAS